MRLPFSRSSFLLMLLILVLGLFAYRLSTQAPVRLAVEIPQHIVLQHNMTQLSIPVRLTLSNRARSSVELRIPSDCDILRWVVVGAGGRFVQAQGRVSECADMAQNFWLEAGEDATSHHIVALDLSRFAPNETYLLQLRFWNKVADARFYLEAPSRQ